MFNQVTINHSRTEHVPFTKTVIEQKAPTDDSIRLYGELMEKAHKSVLLTLELKDNSFNLVAVIEETLSSRGLRCFYKFSLNGKSFHHSFDVDRYLFMEQDKLFAAIVASVSEKMASVVGEMIHRDLMKITYPPRTNT